MELIDYINVSGFDLLQYLNDIDIVYLKCVTKTIHRSVDYLEILVCQL